MGITRYPHGILAAPTLNAGGARFDGWWGKTYFVDYDHGGTDTANGLSFSSAFTHLQTAIDTAARNDVIYIRNRDQDITSTDPETIIPASTTNWSIAEAKTHLSIIGASNISHIPSSEAMMSVILKGHATANTTAVMDVQGAFTLLENLGFHRGGSTSGGLVALTGNSTSLRALGTVVSNCLFRLSSQTTGAIYNLDNWWVTVYGCIFHDCRVGIEMYGSSSTVRRVSMIGCRFRNQTAASVDMNIYIHGSNGQDIEILNCDFECNAPAQGTNNLYINVASAATGLIARCNFPSDTTEGTVGITNNGLDMIDCHQAIAVTNDEAFGKAT